MRISASTLSFLEELSLNNNKERFHEHRPKYDHAKQEFLAFVEQAAEKLNAIDPRIDAIDPKKAMFRINRDIRFSKDKSPYKNNFGANIAPGWRKSPFAAYYIHLCPWNNSFIGWWVYRPESIVVTSIRNHIWKHPKKFQKILSQPSFIETFERPLWQTLKRPPRGFDKDHVAIDYIKMKDWYVLHWLKDSEVIHTNFLERIIHMFEIVYEYNAFLNEAIDDVIDELNI